MADLRHCNHCGQDKPLTDCSRHTSGRQLGQPTSWCNECLKARAKQHRLENPEQYKISDARRTQTRSIRAQTGGLSSEELAWLKQVQAGVCPLCLRAGVALQADRAPATGEVRGLLCATCKRYLSFVEKDGWRERAQVDFADAPGRTRQLLAERRGAGCPPNADGEEFHRRGEDFRPPHFGEAPTSSISCAPPLRPRRHG